MKLKYLVLSDIHLGHNINKTEFIIENLHKFFSTYKKELKNLDIIFLAGDIFDKLLVTSGRDFLLATEYLTYLILYCKKHNIKLRILEGTPSHDWKQSKVISTIVEKFEIDIDYKYIDTLEIEYIEQYKCHILYIPDEYKNKASDTLKEVKKLMKQQKLEQVDIAIMHGQFTYQLPGIVLESSHNEQEYLNLVKYYISIGHIHTHSVFERIIAQGSFDRLAHGEEEDKGGVVIELNPLLGNTYSFLPNKEAMVFKTYDFSKEDIEGMIKILDKDYKSYKSYSNIRLSLASEEMINKSMKTLKERYPKLTLKFIKKKTEESNKINLLDINVHVDSFQITKENIKELMDEEMSNYELNEQEKLTYNNEFKKILEEVG